MTCIVGLVDQGSVYIGGDSAGVAGLDLTVRADAKVFRNGPFLMGFTSSFRMGQLLRYSFRPPLHDPTVPTDRFLATTVIDAIRECLKTGGYAQVSNNREEGGFFLLGYQGGLYGVESDFQLCQPADPYMALGCGQQIAHGVLFSTEGQPPRDRILTALRAAERFSAGVRGPFIVERLDR